MVYINCEVVSINVALKVGIFPEAKGRGKYTLPRVQYIPIFHKDGLNSNFITQASLFHNCAIT